MHDTLTEKRKRERERDRGRENKGFSSDYKVGSYNLAPSSSLFDCKTTLLFRNKDTLVQLLNSPFTLDQMQLTQNIFVQNYKLVISMKLQLS